jgi:hypothetical protein
MQHAFESSGVVVDGFEVFDSVRLAAWIGTQERVAATRDRDL